MPVVVAEFPGSLRARFPELLSSTLMTSCKRKNGINTMVVLSIIALTSSTLNTISYLQDTMDSVCCGRDMPIESQRRRKQRQQQGLQRKHYWTRQLSTGRRWSRRGDGTFKDDQDVPSMLSPLAQEIEVQMSNCSIPVATFHVDNNFGLGSHLVLWSQAFCNAQEMGYRVQTHNPDWLWLDQSYCSSDLAHRSPFLCYFPVMEDRCTADRSQTSHSLPEASVTSPLNVTDPRNNRQRCRRIRDDPMFLTDFRAAAMEYIFQQVSPIVLEEAERHIGLLFEDGVVPKDLIAVHIRWGDKFWEMDLAPISEYTAAVTQLLEIQGCRDNSTAHIYLATEDPRAEQEFRQASPPGWTIYTDRTVTELDSFRPAKGNRASWTARNTKGRAGLMALASLLVALEADYFVLTTGSNWSRLMNQLRQKVVDPRCGNCTHVIDLRPGEW